MGKRRLNLDDLKKKSIGVEQDPIKSQERGPVSLDSLKQLADTPSSFESPTTGNFAETGVTLRDIDAEEFGSLASHKVRMLESTIPA